MAGDGAGAHKTPARVRDVTVAVVATDWVMSKHPGKIAIIRKKRKEDEKMT